MASGKDVSEASPSEDNKQNTNTAVKTMLAWRHDLVFTGSTPQGCELAFDGRSQDGCKPTEALLLSLAGCMGIDIITILTKMRSAPASLRMEIEGQRNPEPPQFYKSVDIVMHLTGKNLDAKKVDRAIALSREKYCSVYHSLRSDLSLTVRYILTKEPAASS